MFARFSLFVCVCVGLSVFVCVSECVCVCALLCAFVCGSGSACSSLLVYQEAIRFTPNALKNYNVLHMSCVWEILPLLYGTCILLKRNLVSLCWCERRIRIKWEKDASARIQGGTDHSGSCCLCRYELLMSMIAFHLFPA